MRAPRPPLQPPAVALESRATVKLQPDVDIDLGQQHNLDSATQAAERECRHGRSQLGMRADVTAAPPRKGRSFGRVARGASVKRHTGSRQEVGWACATGLGADRRGLAGYPLTDHRQFDILVVGPGWRGSDAIGSTTSARVHHAHRQRGGHKPQQAERVRRIGLLLGVADDPEGQARVTALKQGLQELGWIEGPILLVPVEIIALNVDLLNRVNLSCAISQAKFGRGGRNHRAAQPSVA